MQINRVAPALPSAREKTNNPNLVCPTSTVHRRASFPTAARPPFLRQGRAHLQLHQTAWQSPETLEKLKSRNILAVFLTQPPFLPSLYLSTRNPQLARCENHLHWGKTLPARIRTLTGAMLKGRRAIREEAATLRYVFISKRAASRVENVRASPSGRERTWGGARRPVTQETGGV